MTNFSRTGAAIFGFTAVTACLHCGSTQTGEVGIENTTNDGADAGSGASLTIPPSCTAGSANQMGCPCTAGQTIACYTGPASTRGVGTCKDGTETCNAGALNVRSLHFDSPDDDNLGFGPCTGEVLPTSTATCGGESDGGSVMSTGDDGGGSDGATAPVVCPGALTKWVAMSTVGAPPSLVAGPPLVWTGTEVVVFSGRDDNDLSVEGGWLYNPSTDSWRQMSANGRPVGRVLASMLWTGSRFIVWGGEHDAMTSGQIDSTPLDDGGIYDPLTDTWEAIPTPESEGLAEGPSAGPRQIGWTGSELAIFGGDARDGWFYNPSTKAWRVFGGGLGVLGPAVASLSIDVWTGTAAVEWGDTTSDHTAMALAEFTDASGAWTQRAPSPLGTREGGDFVQAGDQIFVHGGRMTVTPYTYLSDGAMYNPTSDSWTLLPSGGGDRGLAATVWTGCDVLEIGGLNNGTPETDSALTGVRYTPATQTWSALPALPQRFLGEYSGAVWAGDQLVAFASGGNNVGGMFAYRLMQ